MFKAVTQSISERLGEQQPGMKLDPAVVASSFGVAYEPHKPLPNTGRLENHVEFDDASLVLPDLAEAGRQKVVTPVLTLAMNRLNSLKPRSEEREQQVAQMLLDIVEPLTQLDMLVAILESEHRAAWEARWEADRVKGRALIDVTLPELHGAVNAAQMRVNEAAERKGHAQTALRALHLEHSRISSNRFATQQEIDSAAKKLAKARGEMEAASDAALEAVRAMAMPESKLATARENLELLKQDMDKCVAELKGEPYFSLELGLSTRPTLYRDSWQ
jgi:hypothetical protein